LIAKTIRDLQLDVPPPIRYVSGLRGIVGGLWGGDKEACLAWKEAYHRMLHLYFEKGRYAGNDQMVMLSTLLENPSLACVVSPTRADINQWFFLPYLLSSLAEFKQDLSYSFSLPSPSPSSSSSSSPSF
jgi:hypothetical protein